MALKDYIPTKAGIGDIIIMLINKFNKKAYNKYKEQLENIIISKSFLDDKVFENNEETPKQIDLVNGALDILDDYIFDNYITAFYLKDDETGINFSISEIVNKSHEGFSRKIGMGDYNHKKKELVYIDEISLVDENNNLTKNNRIRYDRVFFKTLDVIEHLKNTPINSEKQLNFNEKRAFNSQQHKNSLKILVAALLQNDDITLNDLKTKNLPSEKLDKWLKQANIKMSPGTINQQIHLIAHFINRDYKLDMKDIKDSS